MGGGRGGKKSNPSKKDFFLIFFVLIFFVQLRKNISSLFYIYNLLLYHPAPSAYNFKHSSRRLAHFITVIATNHTVQKQSDDASQNTYKEN